MSTESRKLITTLIFVASVLLTPAAIKQAYATRGYWAVGGEWMLIPLGLLVSWFWMDVTQTASKAVKIGGRSLVTKREVLRLLGPYEEVDAP